MPHNPFDDACRYLLRLDAAALLAWLLRAKPPGVDFVEWLDTRQVPWPGQPGRTCDTVAHLRDPEAGGRPWAVVVEFQVEPDELMFGRGLAYLGELWQACKPTEHRGDRFEIGLVVVNLTGTGRASRRMRLFHTRLRTILGVIEWNLSRLSAKRVLREIEAGEAPRSLLAFVPLFKGGDRAGIIKKWLDLAGQEADKERRKNLGLATVLAEAAGRGGLWREALKEWDVIESKIVKEWTAKAREEGKNEGIKEGHKEGLKEGKREGKKEGKKEGNLEGRARMLLDILEGKFGQLPDDLPAIILACKEEARLSGWGKLAGKAKTIGEFRQQAGV